MKAPMYHTLIADESTDVSVTKMLILYAKFRPCNAVIYKTVFAGMLQLQTCDSTAITAATKEFYATNNIDIRKTVMFRSDDASVMLGKNNGVAAQMYPICLNSTVWHIEKTWGLMMCVTTSH